MVYLINFLGHKTLKICSLLILSHLLFRQQNVPFSLINGHTLALTRWFFKFLPERNEINGGCKNVVYFLMITLSLWKRGWYIATRVAPVTFLSGPSNNSSKRFSETLLCWASTSFCRYCFLQNQVFKFSRCFWKVNGDEQVFWYATRDSKQLAFGCEMGEQN